ncbi:MAG: hypothetical protein QNK37_24580 [Acidobacteriota bacterium]|nr:hypothetical protein [Acidobacteriota bacterium]
MAEKLNLDRLEELLETMEPAKIRETYAAELDDAGLRMLATFEALDDDLGVLKAVDPAPPLPQAPAAPRARIIPFMKYLPMAAVLVGGLLIYTLVFQPDQMQTAPMEESDVAERSVTETIADAPQPMDDISEVLEEESRPQADRSAETSPQLQRAEKRKAAPKPAPQAEPVASKPLPQPPSEPVSERSKKSTEPQTTLPVRSKEGKSRPAAPAVGEKGRTQPAALPEALVAEKAPEAAGETQAAPAEAIPEALAEEEDAEAVTTAPANRSRRTTLQSTDFRQADAPAQNLRSEEDAADYVQGVVSLSPPDPIYRWLALFSVWTDNKPPRNMFTRKARIEWPTAVPVTDRRPALNLSWTGDRNEDGAYILEWRGTGPAEGKQGNLLCTLNKKGRCTKLIPKP